MQAPTAVSLPLEGKSLAVANVPPGQEDNRVMQTDCVAWWGDQ